MAHLTTSSWRLPPYIVGRSSSYIHAFISKTGWWASATRGGESCSVSVAMKRVTSLQNNVMVTILTSLFCYYESFLKLVSLCSWGNVSPAFIYYIQRQTTNSCWKPRYPPKKEYLHLLTCIRENVPASGYKIKKNRFMRVFREKKMLLSFVKHLLWPNDNYFVLIACKKFSCVLQRITEEGT